MTVPMSTTSQQPRIFWFYSKKTWWIQLETEAKTNFEASADTSFKSAVAIGRMLNRNMGVWIKPEVPWGPHREGDFTLKLSFFYVK